MASVSSLGLVNCSVTISIGGNLWSAEGYEISVYAGGSGYFAKTKNPANANSLTAKRFPAKG